MPYQRKPIEYDYIQYDGTNADGVQEFVDKYPSTHYGDSVFKRLSGNTLIVAQNANSVPHVAVLYEGNYLVVRSSPRWQGADGSSSESFTGWFASDNVDQLETTTGE